MKNPKARQASTQFLHDAYRQRAEATLAELERNGAPFRIFETYRTPERQAELYSRRPRVTKARPWQSFHQYGMAADFVLYINGRWSWSTKTQEHRDYWNELHRVAISNGLTPLSWERPHLQFRGIELLDLRNGNYPEGGGDPWAWNLNRAIERYPMGAPPLAEYEEIGRPATEDGLEHD